ncbi:hypothetical protein BDD12DRAFT_803206 [Trichophaea hybrida]|nr:hypothetical protein BDD12DRAFT_803206 [Trichophaea hybrida]
MSYYHDAHPDYFATAPAPPPPPEPQYIPPPPASAFSPIHDGGFFSPSSPLVVAASPAPSIGGPSRSASRVRGMSHGGGEYVTSDNHRYLAVGGYGGKSLSRSNSERGRDRGHIVVEGRRGGHSRSRSEKIYYDAEPRKKQYYIDDDGYSIGSGSSYGGDSRDRSRPASRHHRHSRTPSCASGDSAYDDRYSVGVYNGGGRPSRQEEELTEKLKEVQKQLERVQVDAEKKRMQDEQQRLEKLRSQEIERKVQEQLLIQKKRDEEKAKKEKEQFEAEKRRIAEAAKKLLDEQAAAAAKAKEEDERKKREIQAIVDAERAKYAAASSGKKTYTRFSKTHLCKEALEERGIPFTEEVEYFLVHRFVEKSEQQYLWNRTKEIRNYYRQIQEAADKAPTVRGPDGGYVKYVQIAGQPYPMALPVTITHTPGGGQTQRVDPVKIKWSDIFKGK